MNKFLLTVVACFIFSVQLSYSQCIPDPNITIPGIYPDSATGLAPGMVGDPYSEVIQIRVPLDTSLLGVQIVVDSITLLSVSSLPPGLSSACNPSTCKFLGGTNGCILIDGIPTAAGSYQMKAVTSTRAHTLIGSFQLPAQIDTIDYYIISIAGPNSINNLNSGRFEMMQNEPNPFNSITNITFNTPIESSLEFKVYNLLGKEVLRKTILTEAGKNILKLEANDFTPGVYMYSLSNGVRTFTKRMIVSKK
ncbi:MAG: T9SS type A sorting domain-containing protein [Bacteroidetes bacterium]|nr:T9SS type A sorting domain-containing protein [Bacteroidota bacterium]